MASRNIVVVMSDDHGRWCTGAYGNQEVQTPTLDYLAEAGVRMDNAFCPSPVCSPARASFFTGRRPSQHGVHDWIRIENEDDDRWLATERTLPELLGAAGYRTGLSGKWHCGRERLHEDFDVVANMHDGGFDGRKFSHRRDRWITDRALEFVGKTAPDDPFFLFVGYTATHSPWRGAPDRLRSSYGRSSFSDIPSEATYRFGRSDVLSQSEPARSLANYYAAVQGIDEQVGRLVDGLGESDALEDTVFVYTSDHGLNCGHHGIWGKGNGTVPQNMLEESVRVPLIVGPYGDVSGGQRRDEFVDHCDLFRTLLEAAGVEPPADRAYPGASYWGQLSALDGAPAWTQQHACEYGDVRMLRTERYKLVRRYFEAPDLLFDLARDPRETTNLLDDPGYADVARRLRDRLDEAFDPFVDPAMDGREVEALPGYNGGNEPWNQTGRTARREGADAPDDN